MFLVQYGELLHQLISLKLVKLMDEYWCILPDQHDLQSLLELAREYQVQRLTHRCEERLLQKQSSLDLILLAQDFSLKRLLEKCLGSLSRMSLLEIKGHPRFEFCCCICRCQSVLVLAIRVTFSTRNLFRPGRGHHKPGVECHNWVWNGTNEDRNWSEANQLAINRVWPRICNLGYRASNSGSDESRTRTLDNWVFSPVLWPLGHALVNSVFFFML